MCGSTVRQNAIKIATKGVGVIVAKILTDIDLFIQNMTPEKARDFLKKVLGPERRTLEGSEKEHMLTLFALIEPHDGFNDQRAITDVYEHSGKIYHVTNFEDGDVVVQEIMNDL